MIGIIGGGPAGSHAAYLLAKEGWEVVVFEEHSQIGRPVQCTGIVTQDLLGHFKPKAIVNRITSAAINSPSKRLRLRLSKPNLIINRTAFDNELHERASRAGAKYILNSRVDSIKRTDEGFVVSAGNRKYLATILIGADGPGSITAKEFGLYSNKKFLRTKQLVVKRRNDNTVEFFFFKHGYGWVVPESKSVVRAGVATTGELQMGFSMLIERFRLDPNKQLSVQGGPIPLFSMSGARSSEGVFTIGDAAGFVKASTGGGIVQALISAELCAAHITKPKVYDLMWRLHLAPVLSAHKLIFNMLQRMSPAELDELVYLLRGCKKELETHSRDNIFGWAPSIILRQPRLLKFLKHIA